MYVAFMLRLMFQVFWHVRFCHSGFRLATRVLFAKRMVRDFNLEDHVQYLQS